MCETQLASTAPLMKKKTATARRDQRSGIVLLEPSQWQIDSVPVADHESARCGEVSKQVKEELA